MGRPYDADMSTRAAADDDLPPEPGSGTASMPSGSRLPPPAVVPQLRWGGHGSGRDAAAPAAWLCEGATAAAWLKAAAAVDAVSIAPLVDNDGQIVAALLIPPARDRPGPSTPARRSVAATPSADAPLVPYRTIASVGNETALYLPADAIVSPPVCDEEWPRLLDGHAVWVWHPTHGLLGYDRTDLLTPHDLIRPPRVNDRGWADARFGEMLPQRLVEVLPPPLRAARRSDSASEATGEPPGTPTAPSSEANEDEPSVEELVRLDDVGTESTGDLDTGPQASLRKLAGHAVRPLSRAADRLARRIAEWKSRRAETARDKSPPPEASPVDDAGSPSDRDGATADSSFAGRVGDRIVDAVEDWLDRLGRTAESLLADRSRAINRLLAKLDDDPDEGLKYAMPTSGGERRPSERPSHPGVDLQRRSVDYDFGTLFGSGGPSDLWTLPDDLRLRLDRRYRELANRELRLGRYRRAAYIFAHLLADYPSGAAALRRGGRYREAALLYARIDAKRDAADCYRLAGMFDEAIANYRSLADYETVAELLTELGQPDAAAHAWNQAVQTKLAADDPVAAAALLETKLSAGDQAVAVLRDGWFSSQRSRDCLRAAVSLSLRRDEGDDLIEWLREIRTRPETALRSQWLATALSQLTESCPNEPVREELRESVRRVVSRELERGTRVARNGDRAKLLDALATLAPHDALLKRDIARHTDGKRTQRPKPRGDAAIEPAWSTTLDGAEEWTRLLADQVGFSALGASTTGAVGLTARWGDRAGQGMPIVQTMFGQGGFGRSGRLFPSENRFGSSVEDLHALTLIGSATQPTLIHCESFDGGPIGERQRQRTTQEWFEKAHRPDEPSQETSLIPFDHSATSRGTGRPEFRVPYWLPDGVWAATACGSATWVVDDAFDLRRFEFDGVSDESFNLPKLLESVTVDSPLISPLPMAAIERSRNRTVLAFGLGEIVLLLRTDLLIAESLDLDAEPELLLRHDFPAPVQSLVASGATARVLLLATYAGGASLLSETDLIRSVPLDAERVHGCFLPDGRAVIVGDPTDGSSAFTVLTPQGSTHRFGSLRGLGGPLVAIAATDRPSQVAALTASGTLAAFDLPGGA